MLKVSTWDEIGCEWGTHEVDLPPDCRDPEAINLAVGKKVAEDHRRFQLHRADPDNRSP